MVTPFTSDGQVDYDMAKRLAVALLDSGSDGIVVAGTTGESPTLSNHERIALAEAVKAVVGDRAAVIVGTGTYSTAETIRLTDDVSGLGIDGVLLVVPYYNKPPQEGLFRHFEAIARSTELPCILYNVPSRTGVDMTAETAIRLSHVGGIVGIKEASGNIPQVEQIIKGASDGFRVWSGNDGDTKEILERGGFGVISVASHLVGMQLLEMIDHARAARWDEADLIHQRLLPLIEVLFLLSNPISVKYALSQLGVPVGGLRLPLVEADEQVGGAIMAQVRRHKIDLPIARAA
jgi:4-hydroxy-tetrahydrodipicolinate synthase